MRKARYRRNGGSSSSVSALSAEGWERVLSGQSGDCLHVARTPGAPPRAVELDGSRDRAMLPWQARKLCPRVTKRQAGRFTDWLCVTALPGLWKQPASRVALTRRYSAGARMRCESLTARLRQVVFRSASGRDILRIPTQRRHSHRTAKRPPAAPGNRTPMAGADPGGNRC
jgi:aminoglycoside phosphotransferase